MVQQTLYRKDFVCILKEYSLEMDTRVNLVIVNILLS